MKVLIAEDTKDMNRVLTVALEHQGYTVDSALDGEVASELIKENGYDMIILDIMMPKKDGIEVLKELRNNHVITPVLMLTAKSEVDDRVLGLDAGADDYLTKPFAMKELLARVRAMARRRSEYESDAEVVDTFEDLKLDGGTFELRCENSIRLSAKEFELLQTFIKNAPEGLDTQFLLEHVWGDSKEATKDTVWLYVLYLRKKLGAISSNVTILGERDTKYSIGKVD
ncbi:two-component system response regulator [Lachnospiraceae bacterium TWA4]|nr:two-component system response regulator [Lachnospiraceae bacterium TWA4]